MKSKITFYLGILCGILMLLNIYLLLQNLQLKNSITESKEAQATLPKHFPTFSLPELRALRETPGYAKLSLFVLFSPADCASCLGEAGLWKKLYEQFSNQGFCVIGIVDHTSRQELNRFVKVLKLNFPFYLDKTGTIKQQLRLTFSPAKVLVDKDGSILKLDATGSLPAEQQEWYRQTSEFISAYLGDERETNN